MRAASFAAALSFAATALAATGARAEEPTRAETLFREGRKAADAGDHATACAKFAESLKLEPAPGTLLNVADCEERGGQLVAARDHFSLAAAGFGRADSRRGFALGRAEALDKRVAHLTLKLAPSVPPQATVRKGNVLVDATSLGQPVLADPGLLTVVVSVAGRQDRTYPLTLQEGATIDQTLEAGPILDAAAPPPPPSGVRDTALRPPRASTRRTVGFVVGGVGVASLAAGAITGLFAMSRASTVKDHCDANYACDQTGVDAASDGKWLAPVSTVTLIAGAALVGVGAYLVLSSNGTNKTALVPAVPSFGGGALELVRTF
jgi:hypothetical protein